MTGLAVDLTTSCAVTYRSHIDPVNREDNGYDGEVVTENDSPLGRKQMIGRDGMRYTTATPSLASLTQASFPPTLPL